MSKNFGKWLHRAGAMTSAGLVAGFTLYATGVLDREDNAPSGDDFSLSDQFHDRSRAGSPDLSTISPETRAFTPVTINLDNGYGLRFASDDTLFSHESLVNRGLYNERFDNFDQKTPELHAGLLALSEMTPLSYQAFEAAVWKETRFQPDQGNPSGAQGYFQMQPDAFYEGLYRIRDDFPEIVDVTALVNRTREQIGEADSYRLIYEPVDDSARTQLDRLVHDPLISGLAYYGYLNHYMENFVMENIPDLEPNQTDYYLISFRGPGGATEFLQNLRDNPDDPAHSMYEGGAEHPFVTRNSSVYYDTAEDHWRSYQEVYDYIADDMHIGRAPVNMDERISSSGVQIVSLEQHQGENIIPATSLIFSENIVSPRPRPSVSITPQMRPDDLILAGGN